VRFTGVSLKNLAAIAYGVNLFQISGGPEWINTEPFDVEARVRTSDAPPDPSKMREEQRKTGERLRSLLADRFRLRLHSETRELPVYALVVARGGPKVHGPATRSRGTSGTVAAEKLKARALANSTFILS
jgi:uncharacterized protein (TIGR03435 family)